MKFRKLILLLAALACVFAMNVSAFAATIDLPSTPTVVNNNTQKGWGVDGVDGISASLTMEQLASSKYLVLEFAEAPVGGMQFIWQGDGDGWAWNQTDGVIGDNGLGDTSIVIDLSKTAKNYDALVSSTQAKFFLGYYSNEFDDLKITKAYLSSDMPGAAASNTAAETAVETTSASTDNPKTGDNFIIYIAGIALVLAACGTFVFYRKAKAE